MLLNRLRLNKLRWQIIGLSCLLLMMVLLPVQAAGAIIALELQDLTFNGCNGSIFAGSFHVVAYDEGGAVANAGTGVATNRFYTTSYATVSLQQASTSNQKQDFLIDFNGTPITYGTLTVTLAANPTVESPTYRFDCMTGEISIIEGLDDRINPGMGDLIAVLYARRDATGKTGIQVYSVEADGTGVLIDTYLNSDFAPYIGNPPAEAVEISSIGDTTLYALTTGEFQINIGPDIEGKITSVIFNGLPPGRVYKREFNLYNLGQ